MKILVYIFAFIGLFSIIILVINFSKENAAAKKYGKNCHNVHPGMTIQAARVIMGDDADAEYPGKMSIDLNSTDPSNKYFVYYNPPFNSSISTTIYFDPLTNIVTRVICGQ